MVTPLLLLLACGSDPLLDDSGTMPAPTCAPFQGELVLPERVRPGDEVPLSIAAHPDAVLTWAVDEGEVVDGAWLVPGDLAPHVDEAVEVRVDAALEGCPVEQRKASATVGWEDADRALVVYNPVVDGSEEVALAYATLHGLPDAQRCAIASEQDTTLAGADLPAFLDALQACVDAVGPRIHYVVPVYGVPYKVSDRIDDIAGGGKATVSLDALMVYGAAGQDYGEAIYNPLWQQGDSLAGEYDPWLPFGQWRDQEEAPYYLVARIDGAGVEGALALVERTAQAMALAQAGALDGTVYVDGRYGDTPPATDEFGSYESGEWNMWGTRTLFEDLGAYPVVWDGNEAEFGTKPAPLTCPDALYYAGWYSYYHYNDAFTWAPGAIGGHLDSCSACDIRAEGTWSGSALARGITATFGAVNEPYVAGMPEYDQLFRYLTQGASFGEAAYESTRVGLWMMVFVGDPLYRPHPAG
ncbi:TIGR03790 family protein [Myxococcota bacterium]|nr:TIGR03790 family protein [Myxococcota bacterium]